MGKKSKKKGGNSAKKKPTKAAPSKQSSGGGGPKKKLDSDQISLYRIYKYCTEAVIQWGKSTYYKKQVKGNNKSTKASLSHVIFDILGSLADDGVLMPGMVLQDLKLAISYRKRVRRFYKSLPQVSEEDYTRHEWLIQQLENLAKAFRQNQKAQQQQVENEDVNTESTTIREGFEVLALSDDEESVASTEDDNVEAKTTPVILLTPPTPKELENEERQFAIALFMYDLDTIRQNLRERWRKWAKLSLSLSPQDDDDTEAAKNLMAVTASTEYALAAVRKSVLQMSLEIDNFSGFDKILDVIGKSSGESKQEFDMKDFKEGDLVTIQALENRRDLNGKHGFICRPVDAEASERLAVQLFPVDEKQTLSVQPKNLIFSDDTFLRLCQIQTAVGSLNVKSLDIPSTPPRTYGASQSASVQKAGIEMIMQGDKFEKAAKSQDFTSLLKMTVQHSLPLWISLSQYLPDAGAADAVLNAYIRDYFSTGKLKLPLAFALLVTMDSAMACATATESTNNLAEETKDLFVKVLSEAYTSYAYTPAIRLLERDGKRADALYSHLEFTRHIRDEYSVAGMFFPLVSGEMMLNGLRMHFVCGSGLPYTYVEKCTHILHIYWLLRSEGRMGKIPELESILRMYQQRVFFRGGLAKKGQECYLKYQQLAQGVSVEALRYLDGKTVPRRTGRVPFNSDALTYEGLHVTEISRLLDVLQWKSMPIIDKDACFDEIEMISREEFSTIFTAPLLKVSVKMMDLASALELGMTRLAIQSGPQMMPNFALHTSRMTQLDLISYWAMTLGDNRSVIPGEKDTMLGQFASVFSQVFGSGVKPIIPGEEATLAFSLNDHKVDSALWGEKGARRLENLQV
mmetsp:Transcript_1279/g.2551  ORF Transcript_1279/g.2551 Transcript_1279/m.2551 type:complete len:856 (+) Transcript_1279:99-2666(+)